MTGEEARAWVVSVACTKPKDRGYAANYSNYSYALLGCIIETISGQTYEAFVWEQILSASAVVQRFRV